jgi:uncharacterized protein
MRFTYDPAKNERNMAERGLSFDLAEELDWSTALIAEDTRKRYAERRYQTLGLIGEHLHMLVFAPRDCRTHDKLAPRQQARKEPICRTNLTLS